MRQELNRPSDEATKRRRGEMPGAFAFPSVAPSLRRFVAMLLLCAGCHQAHVQQPLSRELLASDPDSQINFWHTIADEPICSNDAAFHGLLLYFDNTDECADYAARVQLLKSRRMLPEGFNQPPDAAVQRGTLAYALCRALQIKGGVTMRVLGNSDRYATRELQFMGLFPPGSQQQTFSGTEYVGIIGKIEDYQRTDFGERPDKEVQK